LGQHNSFFIGGNGGANFSKFKHTEDLAELYSSSSSLTGLNGGLTLGFQIENITLTTGLQYMRKGGHYETDNFEDQQGTGFLAADEKLHYLSVPLLLGYRARLTDNFGISLAMGPSFNMGLGGKIDESIEYYGSEDISTEQYVVKFGGGVNDDYRDLQMGFQFSPGLFFELNDRTQLTFNVTWDNGLNDSFNERYKQANTFFDDYKGNQYNRSTMLTIGYEYHFSFSDKY
jgi:hypothetical protein